MLLNKVTNQVLLYVLIAIVFLLNMETTVINLTLPQIASDLDVEIGSLFWMNNGYLIAMTSLLVLSGRVVDVYGSKRVLCIALLIFTMASLLAALSHDYLFLVVARVSQGAAAAMLFNAAVSEIFNLYSADKKYLPASMIATTSAIALVIGPAIGGSIIHGLGWQFIFYLNIPLCLLFLLAVQKQMSFTAIAPEKTKPPYAKAVWFGVSFVLLNYVLSDYTEHFKMLGHTWGILIVAVILLISFVLVELKSKRSLLPLSILRHRQCLLVCLLRFFTQGGLFFYCFSFSLLAHYTWQLPTNIAALWFIIPCAAYGVSSFSSRWLVKLLGERNIALIATTTLIVSSTLIFFLWVHGGIMLYLLLNSFMMASVGLLVVVTSAYLMRHTESHLVGAANGLLYTFTFMGAAIILALSSAIMMECSISYLASHTESLSSTTLHDIAHFIGIESLPENVKNFISPQEFAKLDELFSQGLIEGYRYSALFLAGLGAIKFLLAWMMQRN